MLYNSKQKILQQVCGGGEGSWSPLHSITLLPYTHTLIPCHSQCLTVGWGGGNAALGNSIVKSSTSKSARPTIKSGFCHLLARKSWLLLLFSCSVVSDSFVTRLLCSWDFPGKNTGVGCHFLLQGIFPTQGSNTHLRHWQVDSFTTGPPGRPRRSWASF